MTRTLRRRSVTASQQAHRQQVSDAKQEAAELKRQANDAHFQRVRTKAMAELLQKSTLARRARVFTSNVRPQTQQPPTQLREGKSDAWTCGIVSWRTAWIKIESKDMVEDRDDAAYKSKRKGGARKAGKAVVRTIREVRFTVRQFGLASGSTIEKSYRQLKEEGCAGLVPAFLDAVQAFRKRGLDRDQVARRDRFVWACERLLREQVAAEAAAGVERDHEGAELSRFEADMMDMCAFLRKQSAPSPLAGSTPDYCPLTDCILRAFSAELHARSKIGGLDARQAGETVTWKGIPQDGGIKVDLEVADRLSEVVNKEARKLGLTFGTDREWSRFWPDKIASRSKEKKQSVRLPQPGRTNKYLSARQTLVKDPAHRVKINVDDNVDTSSKRIKQALRRVKQRLPHGMMAKDEPRTLDYFARAMQSSCMRVNARMLRRTPPSHFGEELLVARAYDIKLTVALARKLFQKADIFEQIALETFYCCGGVAADSDPGAFLLIWQARVTEYMRQYQGLQKPDDTRYDGLLQLLLAMCSICMISAFFAAQGDAADDDLVDPVQFTIGHATLWKQNLARYCHQQCAKSGCPDPITKSQIKSVDKLNKMRLSLRCVIPRASGSLWSTIIALRRGDPREPLCPCPSVMYSRTPTLEALPFLLLLSQAAHAKCKVEGEKSSHGGVVDLFDESQR